MGPAALALGVAPIGEAARLVCPILGLSGDVAQAACSGWPALGIEGALGESAAAAVFFGSRLQQGGSVSGLHLYSI